MLRVPLIFSGPGKTDAELAGALQFGVEEPDPLDQTRPANDVRRTRR
ncbi:hypothetical protein [Cupriavidus necator]|nr:hypothetical protein [Cupriavidus necator]